MVQSIELINTLKKLLKQHSITYASVATSLKMSEANVKRLFATKRFTVDRIEDICHLMQMEITDLVRRYEESRQRISQLTEAQEKELVNDEKLLSVAVSVRNHLSFDDIVHNHHITETECIRCLARLDKLKLIDLLPNNRIKLRVDENFRWLPNGPIDRFFEQQIKDQFLQSTFSGDQQQRLFLFGLLSDASADVINKKLLALAKEFADLHRQDVPLPLTKRRNFGVMLAMRPWELETLKPLRRLTSHG